MLHDSDYLARDAHAFEEDNVKRPQHNPRINSLAREIPRGTIYDRNGVPLATSNWQELERHRDDYAALGVSLDTTASRFDGRHYPFGAATAHLTGDLRTGENFHASNASLVEHDANRRLQGYEYAELAPLIRYRHHPHNAGVARILARDRNLRLTVDIRLQLRAMEILERHLRKAGVANGALVVMEAGTGDVLAMVSAPSVEPARRARRAADAGRTARSRALRTVSAGIHLQAGDRDGGAARRSLAHASHLPVPSAGRRALREYHRGMESRHQGRYRRSCARHDRYGARHRSLLQRVLRAAWRARRRFEGAGGDGRRGSGSRPAIPSRLRQALPFAAYGQGPVLVTPFKMARVAAAIAAGGRMPQGRWIAGDGNSRQDAPLEVLPRRAGGVSGGRDAARRDRRHGAPRDGGHAGRDRREDRYGATRSGNAARLVHGICAVRGASGTPAGLRGDCGARRLWRARSRRRSRAK